MAFPNYPNYPGETNGGDDVTHSPQKTTPSLLASERGTQSTRRIETDSSRNLHVSVSADTVHIGSVNPLVVGSQTSVPASSLTTLATYTATQDRKITRISCSGTVYAKFQLFKNTVLIETKRSGPERSIDFVFSVPVSILNGDIIDVKVTHYNTSLMEDFETTVYGA